MKTYSVSSAIREIQIKATVNITHTRYRRAEIVNVSMPNADKEVKELHVPYIIADSVKWNSYYNSLLKLL